MSRRSVRLIGPGRAGRSLSGALGAAGWRVERPLRRGDDVAGAAAGVDLLVIATPDAAIAEVAAAVEPGPAARGDWATIERHLDALDPSERPAYEALMQAVRRLVAHEDPPTHIGGNTSHR